MKVLLVLVFCVIICYIHMTSSESSTAKKPVKQPKKEKDKPSMKNTGGGPKNKKNSNDRASATKAKKALNIRTPFDKVLEKLSKCSILSTTSPSIAEVMQENLAELQSDEKYLSLFHAAPHTAAFLKTKRRDSTKFIIGLRQALNADWSSPVWKSANEIDKLFQPLKQQFVYTMMRFNCT